MHRSRQRAAAAMRRMSQHHTIPQRFNCVCSSSFPLPMSHNSLIQHAPARCATQKPPLRPYRRFPPHQRSPPAPLQPHHLFRDPTDSAPRASHPRLTPARKSFLQTRRATIPRETPHALQPHPPLLLDPLPRCRLLSSRRHHHPASERTPPRLRLRCLEKSVIGPTLGRRISVRCPLNSANPSLFSLL